MKKLLQSPLLKWLPGLLVRLSSVWLLAAFATFYYGDHDHSGASYSLIWPIIFFVGSLLFSILLYCYSIFGTGSGQDHLRRPAIRRTRITNSKKDKKLSDKYRQPTKM